jgi:hypothetical protein
MAVSVPAVVAMGCPGVHGICTANACAQARLGTVQLGSQAAVESSAELADVREALRGAQQLARDADARAAAVGS